MDSSHLRTVLLRTLFTLFITLYCCIRPDFLCNHDSRLRILSTKLNIVVWVLICPEAVVYWAMRQWLEAGHVAKGFQHRGWTRRHGLFVLMGGFVLCNSDGQPIKTLSFPHFERLCFDSISLPDLTSSEMQERSNFHPTFALIAFLQSSWLLLECFSRSNTSLIGSSLKVITPFEAMTATLVILSWCIFCFAWKKPLDARIPVLIKPLFNSSTITNRHRPRNGRMRVEETFKREENRTRSQANDFGFHLEYPPSQSTFISKAINKLRSIPGVLISILLWPLRSIYNDAIRLVPPRYSQPTEFPDGTLKIPLFYVQNTMHQRIFLLPIAVLSLGISAISLLFVIRSDSALHFFSRRAQLAWRIASITSTSFSAFALGIVILINFFFLPVLLDRHVPYMKILSDFWLFILFCTLAIGIVPFLFARSVLLLLSVIGLGSMPSEAFVTRSWTNYIPHFS